MRGRELKPHETGNGGRVGGSPAMRGRELKQSKWRIWRDG